MPTLAKAIVQGNAAGGPKVNLVGIAVGNGCIGLAAGQCAFNNAVEINTNVPYFRGHALISGATWDAAQADCTDVNNPSQACQNDIAAAHAEVGNVDIYDVNGLCITGSGRRLAVSTPIVDKVTGAQVYRRAPVVRRDLGGPVECIDETIAEYIGAPATAAALNVISSLNWAVCGSNSSFDYTRTELDERVDVYPVILAAGVRVLVYNGDADACVPFIDNEGWTRSMNLSVAAPWSSWNTMTDFGPQVGGYVTRYANDFTFSTVRAAGHMAPSSQPGASWTMFNAFINGAAPFFA